MTSRKPRQTAPVEPQPDLAKKARYGVELSAEMDAFVRAQAARFEDRPGEYLRRLVRAVYLAHQGDLGMIGMLLPVEQLRALLGGSSPPAASSASPPRTGESNTAAIDAALDEYT